jgi:hypothetical protein
VLLILTLTIFLHFKNQAQHFTGELIDEIGYDDSAKMYKIVVNK